jgi:hypothetical protein
VTACYTAETTSTSFIDVTFTPSAATGIDIVIEGFWPGARIGNGATSGNFTVSKVVGGTGTVLRNVSIPAISINDGTANYVTIFSGCSLGFKVEPSALNGGGVVTVRLLLTSSAFSYTGLFLKVTELKR